MRKTVFDIQQSLNEYDNQFKRGIDWFKEAEDSASTLYYRARALTQSREAFEKAQVYLEIVVSTLSEQIGKDMRLDASLKVAGVKTHLKDR